MKLKAFDWICLVGSLATAVAYKWMTGDADNADHLGLALMMSWAVMQAFKFLRGHTQEPS